MHEDSQMLTLNDVSFRLPKHCLSTQSTPCMIVHQPTPTTFQFKQLFNLQCKFSQPIGVDGIHHVAYHKEIGFVFYYCEQFLRYCPFEEGSTIATPFKIHQNIEQQYVNTLYQSKVRKILIRYRGRHYDIVAEMEKKGEDVMMQLRCRGEMIQEMVIDGQEFLDMLDDRFQEQDEKEQLPILPMQQQQENIIEYAQSGSQQGSINPNQQSVILSALPITKCQLSGDFQQSSSESIKKANNCEIPSSFTSNIHYLYTSEHYKLSASICSLVQQHAIDCASEYSIFKLLLKHGLLKKLNAQQIKHIVPFIKTYKMGTTYTMYHINQLYDAISANPTDPICHDIQHMEHITVLDLMTPSQLKLLYQKFNEIRQMDVRLAHLPFSRLFIECFDKTILIDRQPETLSIFLKEIRQCCPQLSHYLVHKLGRCQGSKRHCLTMDKIVRSEQNIQYQEKYSIVRWVIEHQVFQECSLYFSGYAYKLHMKEEAREILSRSSLDWYIHMDYIAQVYGYCGSLFIDFKKKMMDRPQLFQKVLDHLAKMGVIMQAYWHAVQ